MRMLMLADSTSGLDAVTYFFANDALFFLITGGVFFTFGLWFGAATWGRYKRKFQRSEKIIESNKDEIAQLKRRLAERGSRTAAPVVFTPPAFTPPPAALSPLAALVRGHNRPMERPIEAVREFPVLPSFPPGRGFSIWTEPGWASGMPVVMPPSAAFTLWTQKETAKIESDSGTAGTTTHTSTHAGDAAWLYTYEHGNHGNGRPSKSHAHTIWTDRHWKPHPPKGHAPPPAAAFSIWTLPDFVPAGRGPQMPARAFSLWTEPAWSPPRISGPPPRSARSFSLWTEDDYEPAGRGPVQPSQAWSLWTTPEWEAPVVKEVPQPVSAAFSLWTENLQVPVVEPVTAAATSGEKEPEGDLRKTQGSVFARAFAAARAAFKAG